MSQYTKKIIYGVVLVLSLIPTVYNTFSYGMKQSELKEVSGILSKPPEFHKGRKGNRSIKMELTCDTFKYQAIGLNYSVLIKSDLFKDLKKGSKVTFLVSKEDDSNTHLDLRYYYGLKSGRKYYLKLSEYNELAKENRIYLPIAWCASLLVYAWNFWLRNRSSNKIS